MKGVGGRYKKVRREVETESTTYMHEIVKEQIKDSAKGKYSGV